MNREEIARINYQEYLAAWDRGEWHRVEIYENHLYWLGYRMHQEWYEHSLYDAEGTRTLRQRYRDAAKKLHWTEGENRGLTKRYRYLGDTLLNVVYSLDRASLAGDMSSVFRWLTRQIEYERTNNVYAYDMLMKIESHLKRLEHGK